MLNNTVFFYGEEHDHVILFVFDTAMWDQVSAKLLNAIVECTPKSEKEYKKKAEKYEDMKGAIIDHFVATYHPLSPTNLKSMELSPLLQHFGFEYIRIFQNLITPPGGNDRVPIVQQIDDCVKKIINKPLDQFFQDAKVAQHVYYIIGFLCHAGSKEATRRSKKNDVGRCMNSLSRHFSSNTEEVARIKRELPTGLTGLVEKRCANGGLQYPDKALYRAFALIEYTYSHLANPHNFVVFRGRLLGKLCGGMLENATMIDIFIGLFQVGEFSRDTILTTLQYYLSVFGNVRAKNLCYRFNSNLNKAPTVGKRQELAAIKPSKSKRAKKNTKKKPNASVATSNSTNETVNPADEVAVLDKMAEEAEHLEYIEIIDVMTESIDDDGNRKECSIHQHAESHMEEE